MSVRAASVRQVFYFTKLIPVGSKIEDVNSLDFEFFLDRERKVSFPEIIMTTSCWMWKVINS